MVDFGKHGRIGEDDSGRSVAHYGALGVIQYASFCERDELSVNSE